MSDSPSVSDRLRALRNRTGMSVRDVAEKLGRPASTYSSYEGKFKKPYLPMELVNDLVQIWVPLGIEAQEIQALGGVKSGESTLPYRGNIAKVASLTKDGADHLDLLVMQRDVPIYGSAVCGRDGLFELNGQTLDHARRPPRLIGVKDAYALWVSGESMVPWREHGALVYVHPHEPPKINDYVVVQLKPKDPGAPAAAYIKRLIRRTEKKVFLLQHNPREELSIATSDIATIHKIVDWSELMSI